MTTVTEAKQDDAFARPCAFKHVSEQRKRVCSTGISEPFGEAVA